MNSGAAILTLQLTPASGGSIVSPILALARQDTNNISMGWRLSGSMDLNFSILAEDGVDMSSMYCIRIIQPSTDASWSLFVSGGGLTTQALSSVTSPPFLIFQVRSGVTRPIAWDNSSLTYWMDGANCATQPNSLGSYSWILAANDDNLPMSREAAASWMTSDGSIYLFGQLICLNRIFSACKFALALMFL
jgi:hypothetical protein